MTERSQAERLTPEDVVQMVDELPEATKAEFMEGLVKHTWLVTECQSPEASAALESYVRSWVVSMRLQRNEAWRRQVQEAEARFADGVDELESIDAFDARLAEQHRLVS